MGYVQYGQGTQFVYQQLTNFLVAYPQFQVVVESMALPPNVPMPANMFIVKGELQTSPNPADMFKIKMVIVPAFPYQPPKVFVDQQLDKRIIDQKQYLQGNNEIIIPYLQSWNAMQSNLKDLMNFMASVMRSDPPKLSGAQTASPAFEPPAKSAPMQPQDNTQPSGSDINAKRTKLA